ncbi:insecticidal delta-endotoxin Cry8Ea1 family protein [Bacillus cereus]|uniref:insecticidal delta-endotoxin Cry8Ea1 family protein n=1 Tax=Bacillus cereus TaxID=1396 RepID=UPI0009AB18F4|nr:insecticidal delta-endotoxin Cry8Ea1 family protein [Bacillus cereus]PEV15975.1 hypothetical protein CN407_02390 [Bacillus cereus]PGM64722.1 hypothetical protein CN950_17265 [Bacillus cereus]
MATLSDLYPVNVLSSSAYEKYNLIPSEAANMDEIFKQIKDAWGKYGSVPKELLTQAWNYYNNGTIDYLALVKSVISLAGVIPEVSAFVPFANQFLDFIWPKIFGDSTSTTPDLFEQLKPQIKALVDEAIYKANEQLLADTAKGFEGVVQLYNEKVVQVKKAPTVQHVLELHNQIDAVRNFFLHDAPHFVSSGTVAIPHLTMMVTLQLMVLRDAILSDSSWNYTDDDKDTLLNGALGFRQILNTYSKWVFDTLTEELNTNYATFDTVDKWNARNNFLTIVTLTSLDLVALWPTLDPELYPVNTDIDFTRTLKSPILQPVWNPNPFIVPNDFLSYQGELSSMQFSNQYDTAGYSSVLSGIINRLDRSNYTTRELNYGYGRTVYGVNIDKPPIPVKSTNPVIKTSLTNTSYNRIEASAFTATFADGSDDGLVVQGNYGAAWDHAYTASDTAPSQNKLNYFYTSTKDPLLWNFVNVYIPIDTPAGNIIGQPDDTGKLSIKGFPAEKGFSDSGNLEYVNEPLNGAAAVKLTNKQVFRLALVNQISQSYAIRIRYASNATANNWFHLYTPSGSPINGHLIFPATNTDATMSVQGENGRYGLVTATESVTIPAGGAEIIIENLNQTDLFIDRIEFVPVPTNYYFQVSANLQPFQEQDVWTGDGSAGDYEIQSDLGLSSSRGMVLFYNGDDRVATGYWQFDSRSESTVPTNFNRISLISYASDSQLVVLDFHLKKQNNQKFEIEQDLQNITNQVNELFTSSTQDTLVSDVSDYWIDQVVMKIDVLSDEVFGKEKTELRKRANKAKQLSKTRNLLITGNFENLNDWYIGRNVVRVGNHELFKGDYLLLPPPSLFPSYAYQIIEEFKLKPNTRYTVSGFIAQAEGLELIISRYGQEIQKVFHVPEGTAYPLTSEEIANCCAPSSNPNATDSHFFNYSIDIGSLQPEANLGIEVGFRIVKPTGFAKLSNIEIREERALTMSEISSVQRTEQTWRRKYNQERTEVNTVIQPVIDQINALYENEDWNGTIRSTISYADVQDIVLPTLPKEKHWFMDDRTGEHASIRQRFQRALDRAFQQLEARNLFHNGHFTNGLTDWTIEGNTAMITLETGQQVLQLEHWDASAAQSIEIANFNQNQEYQLRVYAKGKGKITIKHGVDGERIEVMNIDSTNFIKQHSAPLKFDTATIEVYVMSEDGVLQVDSIELIKFSVEDTPDNN